MPDLFTVNPGSRRDYMDSYGTELIIRGLFRLFMGADTAAKLEPEKYSEESFANIRAPIRKYYRRNIPKLGDKLLMKTRDGKTYRGLVSSQPAERIERWSDIPTSWEWLHRTNKHKERSKTVWEAAVARESERMEDYVLEMSVDWTDITESAPKYPPPVAAIQKRTGSIELL